MLSTEKPIASSPVSQPGLPITSINPDAMTAPDADGNKRDKSQDKYVHSIVFMWSVTNHLRSDSAFSYFPTLFWNEREISSALVFFTLIIFLFSIEIVILLHVVMNF